MTADEVELLDRRRKGFDVFYNELMPVLVDFIARFGIAPPHEVLNRAPDYAPMLDTALAQLALADHEDGTWLVTRLGYYIGEYFVQQMSGSWFVNDIEGSRIFGRYVAGRFARAAGHAMIDPFEIATVFVDQPAPRSLISLLKEVEEELAAVRPA